MVYKALRVTLPPYLNLFSYSPEAILDVCNSLDTILWPQDLCVCCPLLLEPSSSSYLLSCLSPLGILPLCPLSVSLP